ncbi:BRCT domain-containing protein [Baffinella frigidus]|nr:BRCT domain-containing protein [Cryptophyta sp. CCMP2293]
MSGDHSSILSGVIFALSGYLNPLRTELREAAMSMGAKYSADWSSRCTHLCANFGNTPKIREAENDNATVVHGGWITACKTAKKRLTEGDFPVGGGATSSAPSAPASQTAPGKRARNAPAQRQASSSDEASSSAEESEASFTGSDSDYSDGDGSPKTKKRAAKHAGFDANRLV